MPRLNKPKSLKEACIENIIAHVDTYWLPENSDARKTLDTFFSNNHQRYLISPFDHLDDKTVDIILNTLYKRNRLTRYHLLVFIQWRLRSLDLSFIKKKNLVGQSLAYYVGRNCYNLVELNLFAQTELSSKALSYMLQWLKSLKKLDISHTKANIQVFQVIGQHCPKIEQIYADNCPAIYDECLDVICERRASTIVELSLDNVHQVSKESIIRTLLTCKRLRHFYINGLLNILTEMCAKRDEEYNNDETEPYKETQPLKLKLMKFFIDPDITLKEEKMEALVRTSPDLRQLNINCISPNMCLAYLSQFSSLNELLISNTNSIISFRFGGVFLDALSNSSLGRQLKNLHLIHLVDVNLRSIAKYCPNLVKLNIEFLGYYEPAVDPSLNDDQHRAIRSLNHLSISNVSTKLDQVARNMGQFQLDLTGLIRNGNLKHLSLGCLNELNDEFFSCVFLAEPLLPHPLTNENLPHSSESHLFAYESIETLEFNEMNGISSKLISKFLLERANNLRELNLHACKLISRHDLKRFQTMIVLRNLNCKINWS